MVKSRELAKIINEQIYDLSDADFAQQCKRELDEKGVLTLSNFLKLKEKGPKLKKFYLDKFTRKYLLEFLTYRDIVHEKICLHHAPFRTSFF